MKKSEISKKSEKNGVKKVATPQKKKQNEGRPRFFAPKVTVKTSSKWQKNLEIFKFGVNQPLIREVSGTFFSLFFGFGHFFHFLQIWHFFHFFANFTKTSLFLLRDQIFTFSGFREFHIFLGSRRNFYGTR